MQLNVTIHGNKKQMSGLITVVVKHLY